MAYLNNSINVTKAEADALIAANTLQPGKQYKISGVHLALYNDGSNSGVTIYLQATSTNTFDTAGSGIFWMPKYNQATVHQGIFNTYSTWVMSAPAGVFNSGEAWTGNNGATGILITGISSNFFMLSTGTVAGLTSITGNVTGATANVATIALKSFAIGDKITWGGYVWQNVNGNVGAATNNLTLNAEWTKIAFNTTDYKTTIDNIEFDYANNVIVKRTDRYGATVICSFENIALWATKSYNGHPIAVYQWGNPYAAATDKGVSNNIVVNSFAESINMAGNFYNNTLGTFSSIYGNTLIGGGINNNTLVNAATMNSNVVVGGSITFNKVFQSQLSSNILSNGATIVTNTMNINCRINSNILKGAFSSGLGATIVSNTLEITGTLENNVMDMGSLIQENSIKNTSILSQNTMINPSPTNNFKTYIYRNLLNISCVINLNTLSSNLNSNTGIYYNDLQNSLAFTGNVQGAWITGCNLADGSKIQTSQLRYNSKIQNVTALTSSRFITNLKLDNYIYNFGSVELVADYVNLSFDNSVQQNRKFATVDYADNAAAIAGGVPVGSLYRTGDLVKIVH